MELDVRWTTVDGWQMKVVDLYNEPTLYVRSPEADAEQKIDFPSDDPYFGEISAWIDATEGGQMITDSAIVEDEDEEELPNGILSSFRDACGTYALTWSVCSPPPSFFWWLSFWVPLILMCCCDLWLALVWMAFSSLPGLSKKPLNALWRLPPKSDMRTEHRLFVWVCLSHEKK